MFTSASKIQLLDRKSVCFRTPNTSFILQDQGVKKFL